MTQNPEAERAEKTGTCDLCQRTAKLVWFFEIEMWLCDECDRTGGEGTDYADDQSTAEQQEQS